MANSKQGGEVLVVLATNLPSMLWNLLTSYLRMKQQAKHASKEFYEVLIDNGIPPRMARELRDEYSNMFSLSTIMKSWGTRGK